MLEIRFHNMPLKGVHADSSQNALALDFINGVDGASFDRLAQKFPDWIQLAYANYDSGVIRAARPVTFLTHNEATASSGNFRRPVGEGGGGKSRMKNIGDQPAARLRRALDQDRLQSGTRQYRGDGEAVRARTDDRRIVPHARFRSLSAVPDKAIKKGGNAMSPPLVKLTSFVD